MHGDHMGVHKIRGICSCIVEVIFRAKHKVDRALGAECFLQLLLIVFQNEKILLRLKM
jgi:hypothetical protein